MSEIKSESSQQQLPQQEPELDFYYLLPAAKPLISKSFKPHDETLKLRALYEKKLLMQHASNIAALQKIFKDGHSLQQGYMFSNDPEGANLLKVQRTDDYFTVTLRPDSNSKHNTQWFYFSARGLPSYSRFVIGPFVKTKSLFNEGMKICLKEGGSEWKRSGTEIIYYKVDETYYLTFVVPQLKPHHKVQIAYCYPYSYSQLTEYITDLAKKHQSTIKCQVLGRSLLENNIYQLICSRASSNKFTKITNKPSNDITRPVILVMARVHPSETVSSYVMKGIIDALVKGSPGIKQLLENFEIRLIPMINPDGVKLGNGRYSSTGVDLNRRWHNTSCRIFPQLLCIKQLIRELKHRIVMMIDLHGHSRKKGVFFYGCEKNRTDLAVRAFPYLMSKISSNFVYPYSCFKVEKDRGGTARVFFKQFLKIPTVYTLECSFAGPLSKGSYNYTIQDLQKIGADLVEGFCIFYSSEIDPEFKLETLHKQKQQLIGGFEKDPEVFNNDAEDSGSDSNPSEGKPDDLSLTKMESPIKEANRYKNSSPDPKETRASRRRPVSELGSQRERVKSIVTSRFNNLKKQNQDRLKNGTTEDKGKVTSPKTKKMNQNEACKLRSFEFQIIETSNTNPNNTVEGTPRTNKRTNNILHGRAASSHAAGLLVESNGMKKLKPYPDYYGSLNSLQNEVFSPAHSSRKSIRNAMTPALKNYDDCHGSAQYMRVRKFIQKNKGNIDTTFSGFRMGISGGQIVNMRTAEDMIEISPLSSIRRIEFRSKQKLVGRSLSKL